MTRISSGRPRPTPVATIQLQQDTTTSTEVTSVGASPDPVAVTTDVDSLVTSDWFPVTGWNSNEMEL
jgi:hypothetical protein